MFDKRLHFFLKKKKEKEKRKVQLAVLCPLASAFIVHYVRINIFFFLGGGDVKINVDDSKK